MKELFGDRRSVISWIIAMIMCPLGVAFSTKGGFGVSMIEAPVYVLHIWASSFWSWFSFGTSEYFVQGLLLLVMCCIVKKFRPFYLLSFGTAIIYGFVLDGWLAILGEGVYETMGMRLLSTLLGILLTAFAVSFFFRTKLPLEVWELFVKEISDTYTFSLTKFKWIYDFSSLGIGILLMLLFFGSFHMNMIGIGTIVTTIVNAPIIGMFGYLQDCIVDFFRTKNAKK